MSLFYFEEVEVDIRFLEKDVEVFKFICLDIWQIMFDIKLFKDKKVVSIIEI